MKKLLLGVSIFIFVCVGLLIGEWVYSEITFQIWLRQNEYRIDFYSYDEEEQVKEAILEVLPLGSSEEKVKAFYIANDSLPTRWKPRQLSAKYENRLQATLLAPRSKHGIIFTRPTYYWVVLFELDNSKHTLVEVRTGKYQPK